MFGQNLDHSVKDTHSSCLHVKAWATDAFKIHIFRYNALLTRITAVFTADTPKGSDSSHCLFVHISFQSLFILINGTKVNHKSLNTTARSMLPMKCIV